jgi:hypothetical protein
MSDEETTEETTEEALKKHPFGKLAESSDLDDLPEPKPKVDVLFNHAPRPVPVALDEAIEAGKAYVEETVAKLKEAKAAGKAQREEAKAEAKAGHESREAARKEDRAERAEPRAEQLPAKK